MRRLLLVLLLALCALPARGQERPDDDLGAYRDTLRVGTGAPLRLRPFVLPQTLTLRLNGAALDTTQFRLDARTGDLALYLQPPPDTTDVLVATYRTLPFEALDRTFARRRVQTDAADSLGREVVVEEARTDEPLFAAAPRLRRSGSISRGVVVGNRRDVSLESGLRMELEGELTDGVRVQAVLTDANTPIQPEGTTQRLSDFDRVYVQLDTRRGQARLGDIDLAFTGTAFAPFVRKLQGAAVSADVGGAGPVTGVRTTVAGAVARGFFRSQDLEAVEGVQGPYRLLGRDGEAFILVLAGSERVYLDGVLMTRGEANDYVIDYATAEITFTPRRLITAERRITVDFEYTTGAFTRTVVGTQTEVGLFGRAGENPRLRLRGTFVRESDGSAFADELGLTEADLDLIAAAGDDRAVRSGAERVPFDPESPFVLYTVRDTTVAGETHAVYVPATAADREVYRVRFSRVEPGTGSYVRAGRLVNGILYEWVGPTGGDYVPLRILPKPELRQVLDFAGTYEPVPGLEVFGEWARSVNDQNRLSDLDAGDDAGGAYLGGVRLQPIPLLGGAVSGEVSGRLREATFEAFERIRPVEFNRRWNLGLAGSGFAGLDSLREAVAEGVLRWQREGGTEAFVEAGTLALAELFDGRRAAVGLAVAEDGWPRLLYRLDVVESENRLAGDEGVWLRQGGQVSYLLLQRIEPFVEVEQERRAQDVLGTDSLTATALAFVEVRPGVRWAAERLTAAARFEWRDEQRPLDGRFADAATAYTVRTDAAWRPTSSFSTEAHAAYRTRRFTEAFRLAGLAEDGESVAVGWNARWTPAERAVELNTVYEALTERAPLQQEIYLRVGPELGEYVWEDLNGDGVQQLDEFREELTPLEGEYVRSFVPGDELIPTVGVQGQVRLRVDGPRLAGEAASGWRRALAAVTSLTTLDVQERTEADGFGVYVFDPGTLQQPGQTLNGRLRVTQELGFFRGTSRYGGRLFGSHLQTLNRLATGTEERLVETVEAEASVQVSPPLGLRLQGSVERDDARSPFASRTYAIRSLAVEPEATWTVNPNVILTGGVRWARNRDEAPAEPVTARVVLVPLRARLAVANRLQVFLQAERADVALDGPALQTGQALFELTERRGEGTSYLWSASGQYTINEYLRASFTYEGRAPAEAPVIHNLRLQLSAVF